MLSTRNKTIALIAAGLAVALGAGVGVAMLVRGSDTPEAPREVRETGTDEESSASTGTIETTPAAEVTVTPPAEQREPTDEEAPPVAERETPSGPTERQPGLVTGTTEVDGVPVLKIDYVQFLTGGEAADAAAAHGDESPPPNDYYVVNDNPKIRQFKIQPGIPVFVVTNDDGTSDADGHTISLNQWIAALNGPHAGVFRSTIYWVTVTDGTITKVEAQYLP